MEYALPLPLRRERPSPPSFSAVLAGLEPLQYLGLSQDLASAAHNVAPSPENGRQRQRRVSREIARELKVLLPKLALHGRAEDFQHAKPAECTEQAGGVASYFDCSPISLMGAH